MHRLRLQVLLLRDAGCNIVGVASRTRASAETLARRLGCPVLSAVEAAALTEALFITTKDDAIETVVKDIARDSGFRPGQIVLHMSGALSSEVLSPAAAQGAVTLSLHPIQSFASVEQALKVLPGSFFSVEGDERGYPFVEKIVTALGGRLFTLAPEAKVIYHAAACVASNFFVSLVAASLNMLEAAGIKREVGLPALIPLIEGTINNIKDVGIPKALTGPISRGDTGTVEKHLAALKDLPGLLDFYSVMGLATVDVALAKGTIDENRAGELKELLKKPVCIAKEEK